MLIYILIYFQFSIYLCKFKRVQIRVLFERGILFSSAPVRAMTKFLISNYMFFWPFYNPMLRHFDISNSKPMFWPICGFKNVRTALSLIFKYIWDKKFKMSQHRIVVLSFIFNLSHNTLSYLYPLLQKTGFPKPLQKRRFA